MLELPGRERHTGVGHVWPTLMKVKTSTVVVFHLGFNKAFRSSDSKTATLISLTDRQWGHTPLIPVATLVYHRNQVSGARL